MVLNIILIAIWLFALPCLIGGIWERNNTFRMYFYGLMTMLALFQVLAIPFCIYKGRLSHLIRCFCICILCMGIVSIIKNRTFRKQRQWLKHSLHSHIILTLTLVLMIGAQAGYITHMEHIDEDDALYLGEPATELDMDRLYKYNPYTGKILTGSPNYRYLLASWPVFTATTSVLTKTHVAILAHMYFPAIVLVWAYLAYALIAGKLFERDRKSQLIFLLCIAWILMFLGISRRSPATFLFVRSWQGKAILAGFGIPAAIYGCLDAFWLKKEYDRKFHVSVLLRLMILVTAICSFTTISNLFVMILIGVSALIAAVLQKQKLPLVYGCFSCVPALCYALIYYMKVVA